MNRMFSNMAPDKARLYIEANRRFRWNKAKAALVRRGKFNQINSYLALYKEDGVHLWT